MRIVATSDWHGFFPDFLGSGDVLLIGGDTLPVWDHSPEFQFNWIRDELIPFLSELRFENIIMIGGNHDFLLQESRKWESMLPLNVHYLEDESVTVGGAKFYGTPWSCRIGKWAFMDTDEALAEKWTRIPDDTDVLLVHGPPFGACDFTGPRFGSRNVGSKTLRERIVNLCIPLVVTGHIHEGYGVAAIGRTVVRNVAFMNEDYEGVNLPHAIWEV